MAERQHRDVPFEYDQTDARVVEWEVQKILADDPSACKFRITGHRVDADGKGYFQVSWEPYR